MCLAVPGKIESIKEGADVLLREGVVSFGGIRKRINLAFLPEAREGDYVLVHVGVGISVLNEEEAKKVLSELESLTEEDFS